MQTSTYLAFTVTVCDGIPDGTIHNAREDKGLLGGISVGADGSHRTPYVMLNSSCAKEKLKPIISGMIAMKLIDPQGAKLIRAQARVNYKLEEHFV